jgi:hypothetical protein
MALLENGGAKPFFEPSSTHSADSLSPLSCKRSLPPPRMPANKKGQAVKSA